MIEPIFRDYQEESLRRKALNALASHYAGSEVVVDHLHATKIVVYKTITSDLTELDIKRHAASVVRAVPGIYAAESVVVVKPQSANPAKSEANAESQTVESAEKSGRAGLGKSDENKMSKGEIPVEKIIKRSSNLVVTWSAKKQVISLAGELASEKEKLSLAASLKEKYAKAELSNSITIDSERISSLETLQDTIASIPRIIDKVYGKGSIVAYDRPGKLQVNGDVLNGRLYGQVTTTLDTLATDELIIENNLKYLPTFSVEKDPVNKKLILRGISNSQNSNILASRVRALTRNLPGYTANVDGMEVDNNCREFAWENGEQAMLSNHFENASSGKIIFRSNVPVEITLTTSNLKYKEALETALKDIKSIKTEINYLPDEMNAGEAEPLDEAGDKISETENKPEMDADDDSGVEDEIEEPSKEPSAELEKKLRELRVYFKSGSTYVGAEYNEKLNEVAEFVKSAADQKSLLIIGGYADQLGDPSDNKSLSLMRAKAVQKKLAALGLPLARMNVEFFGEDDNPDKQESRRVEIRLKSL